MRKLVYTFFLTIIAFGLSLAQNEPNKKVLESFDSFAADSTVLIEKEGNPGVSTVVLSDDPDHVEGTHSLRAKMVVGDLHSWGSFFTLGREIADGDPFMDWSGNDTLHLKLKVLKAPADPATVSFRIQIGDRPTETDNVEEYIYQNNVVMDSVHDWVTIKVPLKDLGTTGSEDPTVGGFRHAPSSWNMPTNDNVLRFNQIVSWKLIFVTGAQHADSIEVLYDDLFLYGYKAIQFWVFNGKVTSSTNAGAWSSSYTIEENAGSATGKSAIKWGMNPGWCGVYFDYPSTNMAGNWIYNDTLKLKVKAPAEADTLRVQFGSATGGSVKYFLTKADNGWDGTWKSIKIPLQDAGWQVEAAGFDSAQVSKFEIISAGSNTFTGNIYFDDIWLGNPEFDVVSPATPEGFMVTEGDYSNLVIWSDVPGEMSEVYDLYYSRNPITDVTATGVNSVKIGVAEDNQTYNHLLRAPNEDQSVSYYYALICKDAAGNESPMATFGPVTNTAKGVPTISLNPPSNFAADGDLNEWAGMKPFKINITLGTGYTGDNDKPIADSNDISTSSWIAFDSDYMYVAFDVNDDIINFGPEVADLYKNDCPDLYLGFYNQTGVSHTSLKRGAAPDYHFRFDQRRVLTDGVSADSLAVSGTDNYAWVEKLTGGYTVEAKISLDLLAQKTKDSKFVPTRGMRIPIDFDINDSDETLGERDNTLFYSPYNKGNSYQNVSLWLDTWIEDWVIGTEDEPGIAPVQYALSQNYPNPFNPSTVINYSIQKQDLVKIKIYNVLGAEVATLVNEVKQAGAHSVTFNASRLSSGVYFYSIEAGNFREVKKMVFLK